jgi:hypothetical protein
MADQSKKKEKEKEKENPSRSISAPRAFLIHLICGLGLAISLWVSHNFYSINLVSHPSITLSHLGTLQKSLSLVDFEAIVPNCFLVFFFFLLICLDCRECNCHTLFAATFELIRNNAQYYPVILCSLRVLGFSRFLGNVEKLSFSLVNFLGNQTSPNCWIYLPALVNLSFLGALGAPIGI